MADKFTNDAGSAVVFGLIQTIQDNTKYLSEVDGAIGDGDHGVNMNKGFTMCQKRLENTKVTLSSGLNTLGKILVMEIGGSMGPLYGTIFIEMSKACKDKAEIDKTVYGNVFTAALTGLQALVQAKVGDKTLMDTLIPAVEAYNAALAQNKSFEECLSALKTAAENGKNSTKDMVAKIGRASRLGERSRGVLDAGATSCNLILQSMADTALLLLKKS
ncbi:MAG: dihydroxyacetone kinase subunit DhaL [Elusimicrobiota bacterium]